MLELNDESWLRMRSTMSIMYIWLDDVLFEALYNVSRIGINCPSKYIYFYTIDHWSETIRTLPQQIKQSSVNKLKNGFPLLKIIGKNETNAYILEFMNHTIVSKSVRTNTYSLKSEFPCSNELRSKTAPSSAKHLHCQIVLLFGSKELIKLRLLHDKSLMKTETKLL